MLNLLNFFGAMLENENYAASPESLGSEGGFNEEATP
jgi:hypothetical protein